MTASEKFNTVKRACVEHRICQLHYRNERAPRFIQPLGICLTFNRGMVIVCCVENTYSVDHRDESFVSNLPIEDCDRIRITDRRFHVVPDFFERAETCDDWIFHVKPAAF